MELLTAADLKGSGYVAAKPRKPPEGQPAAVGAVRVWPWTTGLILGGPLAVFVAVGLLANTVVGLAVLVLAVVVVLVRVRTRAVLTYANDWMSVTRPPFEAHGRWVDLNDLRRVSSLGGRGASTTVEDGAGRTLHVPGIPFERVAPLGAMLAKKAKRSGVHPVRR